MNAFFPFLFKTLSKPEYFTTQGSIFEAAMKQNRLF